MQFFTAALPITSTQHYNHKFCTNDQMILPLPVPATYMDMMWLVMPLLNSFLKLPSVDNSWLELVKTSVGWVGLGWISKNGPTSNSVPAAEWPMIYTISLQLNLYSLELSEYLVKFVPFCLKRLHQYSKWKMRSEGCIFIGPPCIWYWQTYNQRGVNLKQKRLRPERPFKCGRRLHLSHSMFQQQTQRNVHGLAV